MDPVTILSALIAIPKIGALVESLCSVIAAYWLAHQQDANYHAIIDAAALSARAKTKEDRINALKTWQDVLSRPRYID